MQQAGVAHGERTQEHRVTDGVQLPTPAYPWVLPGRTHRSRSTIFPFDDRGLLSSILSIGSSPSVVAQYPGTAGSPFYTQSKRPVAQYQWGVGSAGLLSGAAAAPACWQKDGISFCLHTQRCCGAITERCSVPNHCPDADKGTRKSYSEFWVAKRTVKLSGAWSRCQVFSKETYGFPIRFTRSPGRHLRNDRNTSPLGSILRNRRPSFQHTRQVRLDQNLPGRSKQN